MANCETFGGAVLAPRTKPQTVQSLVAQARAGLHEQIEAIQAYRGGLPLEVASALKRKQVAVLAARKAARVAVVGGIGRRIDLAAVLRQRRQDGMPRWTIADPCDKACAVDPVEGTFDTDDTIMIGSNWRSIRGIRNDRDRDRKAFAPAGIPPIPPRARDILIDPKIRKRAAWVGVLYQPEEWTEVDPDPAVIVEWRDRPGEYYALAVWGGDRPQLMEFVD